MKNNIHLDQPWFSYAGHVQVENEYMDNLDRLAVVISSISGIIAGIAVIVSIW